MNQEYHKLLKFLYFEGYADSYEDAEYLLEELNDDEFEELLDLYEARDLGSQPINVRSGTVAGGAGSVFKGVGPGVVPDPNSPEEQQKAKRRKDRGKLNFEVREDLDIQNIIVSYLMKEGYTESINSALEIYESMSDEWMYDILEAFKDTDYKEYYKNNHIYPHDDGGERDYAEYNDYINSRCDHRDEHNARREVKKEKGAKVRDWTNEVNEKFRDLKPEQEQRVKERVGELERTIQLHGARVKELDQKPFAKVRPGIRSQRKEIKNSAEKDAKLVDRASDALIRTSVSRSAKTQKRIEDMKKQLRDMGEEP